MFLFIDLYQLLQPIHLFCQIFLYFGQFTLQILLFKGYQQIQSFLSLYLLVHLHPSQHYVSMIAGHLVFYPNCSACYLCSFTLSVMSTISIFPYSHSPGFLMAKIWDFSKETVLSFYHFQILLFVNYYSMLHIFPASLFLFQYIIPKLSLILINFRMSNKNQVNQIFSFVSKGGEISGEKLTHIYEQIYHKKPELTAAKSMQKPEFQEKLNEALKKPNVDEELLFLFYQLDRDKKGYISPEDIIAMFKSINKEISLNQVENSFKYAKIYKNKMTFQDFKDYFHNF